MEAATKERELSGDKAQRIIDAMRDSVARRGAAGSTFEHVAREAGVSRGLLHYYFGTKERLLVEVVRRDTELRIARLDRMLGEARTADDVLNVLVSSLTDMIENDPGYFLLVYELFSAGRRNPDIQHEVGQLFEATRSHVATVFRAKEDEGILFPRLRRGALRPLPPPRCRRLRPPVPLGPEPRHGPRPESRRRQRPLPPRQRLTPPSGGGNSFLATPRTMMKNWTTVATSHA